MSWGVTLDEGVQLTASGGTSDDALTSAGELDVVDTQGARLFTLTTPQAYDARGAMGAARYRWSAVDHTLAIDVDAAWLESSERAYPIVIDPTAVVRANFQRHVMAYEDVNLGSGSSSVGVAVGGPEAPRVGYVPDGMKRQIFALVYRFDLNALPFGATYNVTGAKLRLTFEATPASGVGSGTTFPTPTPLHLVGFAADPSRMDALGMYYRAGHSAGEPAYDVSRQANANTDEAVDFTVSEPDVVGALQRTGTNRMLAMALHSAPQVLTKLLMPDGVIDPNPPALIITYSPVTAPVVSAVSPLDVATADLPSEVTIEGARFQPDAGVTLTTRSGNPVTGAISGVGARVESATRISVSLPSALAPGAYVLRVDGVPAPRALVVFNRDLKKKWASRLMNARWSDGPNWDDAGVPQEFEEVLIDAANAGSVYVEPHVDVDATVHSLEVVSSLRVQPNRTLTVQGDLKVSGRVTVLPNAALRAEDDAFLKPGSVDNLGTLLFASAPKATTFVAGAVDFSSDIETPESMGGGVSSTFDQWHWNTLFANSGLHSYGVHFPQRNKYAQAHDLTTTEVLLPADAGTITLRYKHRFRIARDGGPSNEGYHVVLYLPDGGTPRCRTTPQQQRATDNLRASRLRVKRDWFHRWKAPVCWRAERVGRREG